MHLQTHLIGLELQVVPHAMPTIDKVASARCVSSVQKILQHVLLVPFHTLVIFQRIFLPGDARLEAASAAVEGEKGHVRHTFYFLHLQKLPERSGGDVIDRCT